MGSPPGPAFANIFMSCLEKRFLESCPDEFRPVLYRRYVDDTFAFFIRKNMLKSFLILSIVNIRTLNLQLSSKMIILFRFLTSLSLMMMQDFPLACTEKKTYTGLYSDFDSLAPDKYKTNLISVLIFRVFQICSSYVSFHQEITRIKDILCKNRFPKTLIDRIIKSFLDKRYETKAKEKVHSDLLILKAS